MEFRDFLTKQEKIYESFKDLSKVQNNGIVAHNMNGQGAYIIAFRHPEKTVEIISKLNEKINKIIPIVRYDPQSIHTTISDYQLKQEFIPDQGVLAKLTSTLTETISNLFQPTINYSSFLYNQNSIVIEGVSNHIFLDDSLKIQNSAKNNGLELRLPWGAHITAARFIENKNPEELKEFFNLMKSSPIIGYSNPTAIDVGHFTIIDDQINFKTYERFHLKGD